MKLSVLLFARFQELAGRPSIEVEVPAGATLAQVWEQVRAEVPSLRREHRPLLACNRSYARTDQIVREGEEIAAFPPVSGG